MDDPKNLDLLFRDAVSAIDSGNVSALEKLLHANPRLVRERLLSPGDWLRKQVGDAINSGAYFHQPYLLWFVAENPVRNDCLPKNIADVSSAIIAAAKRERVNSLQEQLDYALGLVCTGRVPRESGVQLELIDLLIDAGATPGSGHGALGGGNLEAAERLIERGGELSLAVALCLGRTEDVARLGPKASAEEKQVALAAAALNGNAEALALLLDLNVDVNAYSSGIHPHATPLHHAVSADCLVAVKMLVQAGSRLDTKDKIYGGTPLDWAEHIGCTEIAEYLRTKTAGASPPS